MGNNDCNDPLAYGDKNIYYFNYGGLSCFPICSIPQQLSNIMCAREELINPFRAEYVIAYIHGQLPILFKKKDPKPKMIPVKIKMIQKPE